MAIKWLDEAVLQRYVRDNPRKWRINGKRVLQVNYNQPFDRYPDLSFIVDGEPDPIPVEVEWTSKKFIEHGHPIETLRDANGCIFVLFKNIDNLGVPQYEIPYDGFKSWVKANAEKLVDDTAEALGRTEEITMPRLWIQYISQRGGAIGDYEIGLAAQTWGIPENSSMLGKFQEIKKNDLIMFVIGGRNFRGRQGQVRNIWHRRSFRGEFDKIQVFRITSDYFWSDEIIWPVREGEIYPHRFNFDELDSKGRNPFLSLRDVKIKKMAEYEKEQLRIVVGANFMEGDPSILVECMHCSKQAT